LLVCSAFAAWHPWQHIERCHLGLFLEKECGSCSVGNLAMIRCPVSVKIAKALCKGCQSRGQGR
jgi:hypothetical protein